MLWDKKKNLMLVSSVNIELYVLYKNTTLIVIFCLCCRSQLSTLINPEKYIALARLNEQALAN